MAGGAALLGLAAVTTLLGPIRLGRLHRAIEERWRPVEQAHRLRAELVARLFEVVQLGAEGSFRPLAAPLPLASGSGLLDDPATFDQWDVLQSETAGLMMELCQAVVGSPALREDPRAKELLDHLVASEAKARAAEGGFARAVEAYRRARQGMAGAWLARRMGLSERSLKVSAGSFWASPALLPGCPLAPGTQATPPPQMEVLDPLRATIPRDRSQAEELRNLLARHLETWRPCVPVEAEVQRKLDQLAEAQRAGLREEEVRMEADLAGLMRGPFEKCRVTRESILRDLRATGAREEAIHQAWLEFVKSAS